MSLTALTFLGVYAGLLVLAFVQQPFFGLCAYMWAFYNNPTTRWWGDAVPDWRWSLIAAVVTLLATLVNDGRTSESEHGSDVSRGR